MIFINYLSSLHHSCFHSLFNYVNTVEQMHFAVELKVENAIGEYSLHEPQEGGWIARAWLVDPKVYPAYQCPVDDGGCMRRQ